MITTGVRHNKLQSSQIILVVETRTTAILRLHVLSALVLLVGNVSAQPTLSYRIKIHRKNDWYWLKFIYFSDVINVSYFFYWPAINIHA